MEAPGISNGPIGVSYFVGGRLVLCVEIRTCINSEIK